MGSKTRTEPQPERRESTERTAAPPIEREHETYEGIFEEDEKREQEHHSPADERHMPSGGR
jgi:hypothetical protein